MSNDLYIISHILFIYFQAGLQVSSDFPDLNLQFDVEALLEEPTHKSVPEYTNSMCSDM